jgi:hypothetical protein
MADRLLVQVRVLVAGDVVAPGCAWIWAPATVRVGLLPRAWPALRALAPVIPGDVARMHFAHLPTADRGGVMHYRELLVKTRLSRRAWPDAPIDLYEPLLAVGDDEPRRGADDAFRADVDPETLRHYHVEEQFEDFANLAMLAESVLTGQLTRVQEMCIRHYEPDFATQPDDRDLIDILQARIGTVLDVVGNQFQVYEPGFYEEAARLQGALRDFAATREH